MKSLILIVLLSIAIAVFAQNRTFTVSGLSSGGYMANQLHVAYSQSVSGAAVIAGGPFYCAKGQMTTALTACMNSPAMINVNELISYAKQFSSKGEIDNVSHLSDSNQKVYIYSGSLDFIVFQDVVRKLEQFYKEFNIPKIITSYDVPSNHAIPTDDYGNACYFEGSPWVNNCGYEAAGEIFKLFYGASNAQPVDENIYTLKQSSFIVNPSSDSMASTFYAYVPKKCLQKNAQCPVHMSLHGCKQDFANVGDAYYKHAGFNRYAENAGIIVLYPQTKSSFFSPFNPNGCWDWWGYSGYNYYNKQGSQMQSLYKIAQAFMVDDVQAVVDQLKQ